MVFFMTSSPGGHTWGEVFEPIPMDDSNDFIINLKKYLKPDAKGLFVACDPDNFENNDRMGNIYARSLTLSGIPVESMDICDNRHPEISKDAMAQYDFVIFSGGHLPTQNAFFKKIDLRSAIADYSGVIIGISAGSMNSEQIVYALPEEEGESIDENYDRFPEGLGLINVMIIPHYQTLKDNIIDGQKMIEEMAAKDSFGHEFLILNDGSYILKKDGVATLYGEAYSMSNGILRKICDNNQSIVLEEK